MAILTLSTLRNANACAGQVRKFKRRFGESVDVTEDLCASVATVFDWTWAVSRLLPPTAWAEYERATESARAEYARVRDAAWAEYARVRDAARAEYERALAVAFARLFCGQSDSL